MQFYFFKRIDPSHSLPFRQFANKQNVITAKVLSLVVASICVCIRVAALFIDFNHIFANSSEYKRADTFIFVSSLVCYSLFFVFKRTVYKKRYVFYKGLSLAYALILIIGCLWTTFVAQHNPSNTMAIFLIGMLTVGVLWILQLREVVFITAATLLIFFFGLHYFQTDTEKLWSNYILAACVFTAFFCISRIFFSYHYNYFIQLKAVEYKKYEISKINQMQTEILAVVAHDLRSPINNISALVDLAKNFPASDEERNEYYDMVLTSCNEMEHIIHDLIEVAKKAEHEDLNTEDVCLNEFMDALYRQWAMRIQGSRKLELDKPEWNVYARLNKLKFSRVIDNILNNSIKFTSDNSNIHIHLKQNDYTTRITITDNGIGIPESLQPYIFDRFSRAGRNGVNGERSYGLGLSICKQIVEQHNGQISIESKEMSGTSFHIDLPIINIATSVKNKEPLISASEN